MCKYTIIPGSPRPIEHRVPLNPSIPLHDESAVDLRGRQFSYFHPVRNLYEYFVSDKAVRKAGGLRTTRLL